MFPGTGRYLDYPGRGAPGYEEKAMLQAVREKYWRVGPHLLVLDRVNGRAWVRYWAGDPGRPYVISMEVTGSPEAVSLRNALLRSFLSEVAIPL